MPAYFFSKDQGFSTKYVHREPVTDFFCQFACRSLSSLRKKRHPDKFCQSIPTSRKAICVPLRSITSPCCSRTGCLPTAAPLSSGAQDRKSVVAAVDHHHLHAGPAERGQRLAQLHLLAGVIAI